MNITTSSQRFSWLLYAIIACSGISCANVDNASPSNVSPSNLGNSSLGNSNVSSSDMPLLDPMALSKLVSDGSDRNTNNTNYTKSLASYEDFKNLVTQVESIRENRLIDAKTFAKMAKEPNTIVLDTRSADFFENAHVKGAINLPFTEFTQSRLAEIIPNNETRILIYCNNNFADDPVNFASKFYMPPNPATGKIIAGKKPIMLALNIPTYLNLYGYGYPNIYELDELVRVSSKVLKVESSEYLSN